MITEEEARKKWCPFVRYVPARKFSFGRIVAAVNRWIDSNDSQKNPNMCCCIASECMAWEWAMEQHEYAETESKLSKGKFIEDWKRIPPEGEGWEDIEFSSEGQARMKKTEWRRAVTVTKGDCGLKRK